jgi:hypothetical protein
MQKGQKIMRSYSALYPTKITEKEIQMRNTALKVGGYAQEAFKSKTNSHENPSWKNPHIFADKDGTVHLQVLGRPCL